MSSETKQTLTDLVHDHIDQFDDIYKMDDPYEELHNVPLEIATSRTVTVVLCTGGPHVEAVATLNHHGGLRHAHIDGYWGGERTSQPVEPNSSLWRALCEYAECIEAHV